MPLAYECRSVRGIPFYSTHTRQEAQFSSRHKLSKIALPSILLTHHTIPDPASALETASPLSPFPLKGLAVTLEPITPQHIPSLFRGLNFPKNNPIIDYIANFHYIQTESDLATHIASTLSKNPSLTFLALRANPHVLNPPFPPTPTPTTASDSHTAVLGILGYRTHPPSRTIQLDDFVFAPELQRTYASTEAHYLQLVHLFEHQDFTCARVWLKSHAMNVQSRAHTERLEYVFEGTMRKDNVSRWGTPRDSDVLSMLDDEWKGNKVVVGRWLDKGNFGEDGEQVKSMGEVRREVEEKRKRGEGEELALGWMASLSARCDKVFGTKAKNIRIRIRQIDLAGEGFKANDSYGMKYIELNESI
ncbi:acetyltransferase, GNAT family [Aspergillus luchuensis]|uniref:Acetyltransferase, GNAT family n=1 Tax=Aspergillus kawachii TaxID=1069201 RepID=A0A146F4U6_ASPKA|nr:acetyltransferase, GNAT family [Aspergillus luchuensis]